MNCLFITFLAISIVKYTEIKAESIQGKINKYFSSDVVKTFENKWKTYMHTYEYAIAYSIAEDYGHKTMNVYINRLQKPLLIANGYYHTDNQVKLVFSHMMLEALPHLYDVDISFPLPSNVIQVEASVSKMILHTSYVLFRNLSDIIFSPADQDPYKNSPFRFQQVNNIGDLAISIEGCSLSGTIIATLSGNSVNLGHHELRLKDCQYTIEIYKLGSGAPPVIANYLPKGDRGLNLETLITRPMLEELVPKLQGAMFSEVNTSGVFSNDLPKIREKQEVLFDNTKNYIDDVVRSMNKKSIEKNMGTIDLEDFDISWDDTFTELPAAKAVKLSKMTLLGLDTVYASHSGGPVRLTEIEIIEQLRFSMLQVIGKVTIDGIQDETEFAVEISDLAVDVTIDSSHKIKFEVLGWRIFEFSCPDLEFLPTESLVIGYLLNEVPKHIKSHLNSVYGGGQDNLYYEYVDEQPGDGEFQMGSNEESHQKQSSEEKNYEGHYQLQDVEVRSDEKKKEIVNLSNHQSKDYVNILRQHNTEEKQGVVKLHHVDAEPNADEHDHVEEKSHKIYLEPKQIHMIDVVQDDTIPGKNADKKSPKQAVRSIFNKKKLFKNTIYKQTKRIEFASENNRGNTMSAATPKAIHVSDNEIH